MDKLGNIKAMGTKTATKAIQKINQLSTDHKQERKYYYTSPAICLTIRYFGRWTFNSSCMFLKCGSQGGISCPFLINNNDG